MKHLFVAILIIGSMAVSVFLMIYLFRFVFSNISCTSQTIPSTCSNKTLDLQDIDILIVTSSKPYKLININYIDNKVEDYTQIQAVYSIDGASLAVTHLPFNSIKWRQVSENKNNYEYTISGVFRLGADNVEIEITSIYLAMVIRAEPQAGKFGGSTALPSVKVKVNGVEEKAYAAVTAGFFNKYEPVDINHLGVRSNWLMYFDKNWNFMHLDKTEMDRQTDVYYPHTFMSKIINISQNVSYLNNIDITKTPSNSFLLSYTDNNKPLTESLYVKSSVITYPGTKMYMIENKDGGVGVYLTLGQD